MKKVLAMAKAKALEVDRRVGIALSVLPPSQKAAVKRIMRSPQTFTRAAAAPGRVQQMRVSGQPLFMMRVSPGLRVIYTTFGDTVYVVDVVQRATMTHFAARKAANKAMKQQSKKREQKVATRRMPDAVEK
jgi:hypothetical protein